MHRSRLAGLIIDCKTDDLDEAARFWCKALGVLPKPATESSYVSLEMPAGEPYVEVQKVEHPSRVHLDIESDDIDAEVARLQALGAKKIADVKTWCVMEAPTGQRFCVVSEQSADFDAKANRWK